MVASNQVLYKAGETPDHVVGLYRVAMVVSDYIFEV